MILSMSERAQVKRVVERWRERGFNGALERLKSLDVDTATADDVSEIIGNKSWVCKRRCDQCGDMTYECVAIGEEYDYESATATVCRHCLVNAIRVIDGDIELTAEIQPGFKGGI